MYKHIVNMKLLPIIGPRTIEFFEELLEKGEISYNNQDVFLSRLSFYLNVKKFEDAGLIELVKKKNDKKNYYRLTEKGKRFALALITIKEVLNK